MRGRFKKFKEHTTKKGNLIQRVEGGGVSQGRARKCGRTFFRLPCLLAVCHMSSCLWTPSPICSFATCLLFYKNIKNNFLPPSSFFLKLNSFKNYVRMFAKC